MERPALYKELLFTEEEVNDRIAEMAARIAREHDPKHTIFISLLNGAQPFAAKLMAAIQKHDPYYHPNVQTMIVSRYGEHREAGQMQIITDLPPRYRDLTGYRVVLLDDLIDEGGTLSFAKQHVLNYGAEAVECAVLVKKIKDPPVNGMPVIYGFETPDVWLTGMGMDDSRIGQEANRWAGWIAVANDA